MACTHLDALKRLQSPKLSQSVHREECTQCFDNQVGPSPLPHCVRGDRGCKTAPVMSTTIMAMCGDNMMAYTWCTTRRSVHFGLHARRDPARAAPATFHLQSPTYRVFTTLASNLPGPSPRRRRLPHVLQRRLSLIRPAPRTDARRADRPYLHAQC
jgi:hypothetical protein